MEKTLLIIGAGAAGMMAALAAAPYGQVVLLESQEKPGRKILATGNGKCNYTNKTVSAEDYHTDNVRILSSVLDRFTVSDTLDFFEEIGIPPYEKGNYIYPLSRQAASVQTALKMTLEEKGVRLIPQTRICRIRKTGKGFEAADNQNNIYRGDAVILAAGGKASPKTGSDGSGFELAKQLGHTLIEPVPALGPLICREKYYKALAGVRTDAAVHLYIDGQETASDSGELQLTEYGISGIPVFQLSGQASRALQENRKVSVHIDFWPGENEKTLYRRLKNRKETLGEREAQYLLLGMLPQKLAAVILSEKKAAIHAPIEDLPDQKLKQLATEIKDWTTEITAAKGFEQCQVCAGGIPLNEVDEDLQSLITPGLYLAGEILNTDGPCGGYNLQWAWSSGYTAGLQAAMNIFMK